MTLPARKIRATPAAMRLAKARHSRQDIRPKHRQGPGQLATAGENQECAPLSSLTIALRLRHRQRRYAVRSKTAPPREGLRNRPRGLDFAVFLGMTARSVAFADRNASGNARMNRRSVKELLDWSCDGASVSHPSAESCAERAQDWDHISRKMDSRTAGCFGAPVTVRVFEGIVADRTVVELRRDLNLKVAEYYAARKRALRALRTIERL